MPPVPPKSSAARLIASARRQPELALHVQQQLPEATRQLFMAKMAVPSATSAHEVARQPGLAKCSFTKTAYSAQLEWFAKSLQRSG